MDDVRVGKVVRAIRQRKGWRQRDLSAAAGVAQSTASKLERGHLGHLEVASIRRLAAALEMEMPFAPRWRGGDLARLLDQDHAALVEQLAGTLGGFGWEIAVEYSFNAYGERGSADIVAWHVLTRTLLVIEVKTQILDLQDLLGTLDRKVRIVPPMLARDRGWRAVRLGRLVIAPATTTSRDAIRRHEAMLRAALPDRGRAVVRWLREPTRTLAGLWLLSASGSKTTRARPRRQRVRSRPTDPGPTARPPSWPAPATHGHPTREPREIA